MERAVTAGEAVRAEEDEVENNEKCMEQDKEEKA